MAEYIELWKTVSGYEGKYEVSNLGNVRNSAGKILKQSRKKTNCTAYCTVCLYDGGKGKTKYVHRLIAQAFIPNPNGYPMINHKDENGTNNSLSNLEWCTAKYNTNYGTGVARGAEKKRGVLHDPAHNKKISDSLYEFYKTHPSKSIGKPSLKRKPVCQYLTDGTLVGRYSSLAEAAISVGELQKQRNLWAVCEGKKKTAYGYIWRWED